MFVKYSVICMEHNYDRKVNNLLVFCRTDISIIYISFVAEKLQFVVQFMRDIASDF